MKKIFKKLSKKTILAILAIIVIGVPLLYLTVLNSRPASAWFDENWLFRQAIPISSHTAAENNVYISVTVDTSSTTNFQAHCGDVRFLDASGKNLPWYLSTDACRSSSSVFHVFLASFPAGAQTIYVYYGNPTASNGVSPADFSPEASNYVVGTLAAQENAPSPSLYWKFDDGQGTTTKDSSSNANTGNLGVGTTNPAWKTENQCISGKCLYFDGTTSKVTGSAVIQNVQSVSFWIRPNTIATQGLIDLDGGTHKISTNASGVISAAGFTSPAYYINGIQTTTPTLVLNQWNHVEITTGTGFDSTATFTIGTDGTNFIKGFIDEVKIYPYARNAAQVKTDYNAGKANTATKSGTGVSMGSTTQDWLSNGLVGYWKMDESSGNASDSSGNSTTLTNTGTATFTVGKYGNGTALNGSSQYFTASDNTALSVTGDLTLTSWIKPSANTAATQYDILSKWDGSNTSYLLAQYGTEIRLYLNSSSNYVTTSGAGLATGTWYHVMATYSAGTQTVNIFLNGVQLTTTTTGTIPSSITDNAGNFYIGAENSATQTLTTPQDNTISDTSLLGDATDSNAATDNALQFKLNTIATPDWTTKKSLIKFDLSSLIGATISSAHFHYFHNGTGWLSGTDECHRIINNPNWTETGATWNYAVASTTRWAGDAGSNGGADAGCSQSGTDWNATALGTYVHPGSNPADGADFDMEWTSLAELTSMVASNQGIACFSSTPEGTMYSSDYTTAGYRPYLVVQYNTPSNYFNGAIDEARIYNRALSPKEVSDLYNWAPGPVGYWKMDDKVKGASQTIVDTSGNANNGTTAGTNIDCSKDPGKYGGACTLNGTDDYISMGNPSNLTNLAQNGDFTVEAWVKNTGTSTYANIINKDNNGTNGWHLMTGTNNYVEFKVGYSTTDLNKANNGATSSLTPNVWHHLVAVFKQSLNRGYVFVDGAELTYAAWGNADGVGTIDSDSTRNLEIGRQNNTSTNLLKGPIDEVKIYNYARTQKQIVSDMNAGHPAVGSPVGSSVAYWKFDAGQGTSANDSTPNANTLTLSSASWINSGKFGKAWNGDGTKWLSRADDADFDVTDTDDYAISLWFKSDAAANPVATEYLIDKGPVKASSAGYAIYAQTDGTICFGIDDDTTWDPDVASCSPTSLYDSAWHHLVAIRDHTGTDKILVYIDGILKDSDLDTTTATLANAQILYLGDSNGADAGDEFNGDLDEVKVYRYALTTDEIKTEYNRGQSIQMGALGNNSSYQPQAANQEYCVPGDASSCAAPVGRWDFEEGKDNTCNGGSNDICDISTSGKDGTHGAGVTWTTGKYGKGMYFAASGVANNIPLGDNFDITGTDNMTWEVWFKTDGQNRSNRRGIGGKKSSEGSNTAGYWMDINTSGIAEALISNATAQITLTSIATVDDSKWHHLVVLINRTTGNSQMYIDGNLNDTDTTPTGDLSNALGYVYGSISLNSAVFPYKGKLDQAMIFNYVRSAAQIAWDYNRGAPVGWWKMDECQGATVNDSAKGDKATIIVGGSGTQTSIGTCTTSGTAWGSGATGKRNASINLDGNDDYICDDPDSNGVCNDSNNFDFTGPFSMGLWIKPGGGQDLQALITKTTSYNLWRYNGGYGYTGYGATIGDYSGTKTVSFTDSQTGVWKFLMVTFDGSTLKIYKNGVLMNSASASNPSANSAALQIGMDEYTSGGAANSRYFTGQMDDVKIFNYALTASQVKNEYNGGAIFFGPTTGSP